MEKKEITAMQMENLINKLGLFEKPTIAKASFVMWFISIHPEVLESAVKGIIEVRTEEGEEITKESVSNELQEMIETWFAVPTMMLEMWGNCCVNEESYKTNTKFVC